MRAHLAVLLGAGLLALALASPRRVPSKEEITKVVDDIWGKVQGDVKDAAKTGQQLVQSVKQLWQQNQQPSDITENIKKTIDLSTGAVKGMLDKVEEHLKEEAQEIRELFNQNGGDDQGKDTYPEAPAA